MGLSSFSNAHNFVKNLVWTSFYSPFWSSWADLSFAPTFRVWRQILFFLLARSIKATVHNSLNPKKATVGHKNFSFCEQTLHKGLIDASCNWLQSTRKNRGQNIFLRKLRAKIQFLRLLFSSLRSISSYNPHTILKNARRGRLKIYIYFYLQKLQVGPGDAACRELQYATKNMAHTNFLDKGNFINFHSALSIACFRFSFVHVFKLLVLSQY